MLWTREQAKALIDRTLSFSKADETFVQFNGRETANLRFARNTATTSGATASNNLAVTAKIGKKSGTVTTAEFDDGSLQRAVAAALEIARLSPENPEAMPVLEPQKYAQTSAYFGDVAGASADWRASAVATAIALSKKQDVLSAGFVNTGAYATAIGNSKGLFGFDRFTSVEYNLTARTSDGSGSGWAARSYNELRLLDAERLARTAIEKAVKSKNPSAIEPGKYTVVLEAPAVADLLAIMTFFAGARQADEGRSVFSKKGGGNRIGERILADKVNIYVDPVYALAPTIGFGRDGLPTRRDSFVEKGVLKELNYSRFWALKHSKQPTSPTPNIIMDGGTATLDELIAGTERGVLVTRFWYIRPLDPQTMLLTGLTRDGLFLIEGGKVTRPIKNMRWNESPIVAFNNIEAMTAPERVVSGEGYGESGLSVVCPAARIREFTFSSASDAV